MGQHKRNETAIAAKNGEIKPKEKEVNDTVDFKDIRRKKYDQLEFTVNTARFLNRKG